jgi:uncharacterized delta-60 repeat protein
MPPGDLDTTFDGNGKKAISFGGAEVAHVALVQANGRIVVAGGGTLTGPFRVARLRPNGLLDTTFGPAGKRRIGFGGDHETAFGGAIQPDGKIVLVGDSDFRVAVARLNPNGTLDTTFDGDGKKVFSWGPISRAQAVVVLPNGKLLVGGFSGPEGGNVQVARLRPNGDLDTTFGTKGIATVDFGGDDFGLAMARHANGRIVIAGRSTVAGAVVARLRANGKLDPDFAGDGRLNVPGNGLLRGVVVQPDNRIVVAGNVAGLSMMTVMRFRSNGTPDPTFDGDGTVAIDIGPLSDVANDIALQPDGKLVVAGSTSAVAGGFAVARLNPNGSPDATFGTAGEATVDFGVATFGNAVALQANGRIVVAGQRTGNDDFAVARLLG